MDARSLVIWLVTIGEPIPPDGTSVRLLRTGMLAQHLTHAGHLVVWWNSDFDHHPKRHRVGRHATIDLGNGLELRLLHGCGYRSHISFARLRDHRQVARAFLDQAAGQPPPDAIVAAYPTIELADACRQFAVPRGIPVALDIRDLWPDIFADALPAALRAIAQVGLWNYNRIARRALGSADALIGVTDPYLAWGLAKAGRERRALDAVIPFAYPIPEGGESEADVAYWKGQGIDPDRQLVICFFGTFGRQFDLGTVIEAARQMASVGDIAVRFVLCGAGDRLESYRSLAAGTPLVLFPGWIDAPRIRGLMALSHLGLAPYYPNRNFIGNLPNKPIEYMSAGVPILTCLDGVLADTVRREGIGLVYRSGDPASLVAAVRAAQADRMQLVGMGSRARDLFDRCYRSDIVMEQYRQFILRLADSRRAAHTESPT